MSSDQSLTLTELEQQWKADPLSAFELGVELAFHRWEVLTMAIEQGWAGAQDRSEVLRDEFIDATIDLFVDSKTKLHWDDVSDYLYEGLLNEFHVDAQDDSEIQLAKLLCQLYDDVMTQSNFEGLKRMYESRRIVDQQQRVNRINATVNVEESDDDDEDGDEDDEKYPSINQPSNPSNSQSSSQSNSQSNNQSGEQDLSSGMSQLRVRESRQPEVDADGWTTVKTSKGKKR